jgi:HlyD family secretion protein
MSKRSRVYRWIAWTAVIMLALGTLVTTWAYRMNRKPANMPVAIGSEKDPDQDPSLEPEEMPTIQSVTVIRPKKGELSRLSTQPGSIEAYESVRLYGKVPGFLKYQTVDIGDRVKEGQVLAVVDVPELRADHERNKAALEQANARVDQMKARVDSAIADLKASEAAVIQAEATARSSVAWVSYRKLQMGRIDELVKSKSLQDQLYDESKQRHEAAVETELAAKAAIATTTAKVAASTAKIEQAKADVKEAEAQVKVAQAEIKRVEASLFYSTITAPFDGVITQRSLFVGDFVHSANESGSREPLLTVNRTDRMRVIVQMPDRDVPWTDVGDTAEVVIDALPEKKLYAKISRKADHESKVTRLMRIELDMPNPTGKICEGMYGQVTIVLDQQKNLISIPSPCVSGKLEDGKGLVYVVRDGHAYQVPVRLGTDNGLRVAVLDGLTCEDEVILHPGNALFDGAEVIPTAAN